MYMLFGATSELRTGFRVKLVKAPNNFSTGRSKEIPLLQFFFVRASVVLYLALFLFFFWCLGKVLLRDCCIPWVSIYIFVALMFLLLTFILFI